MSAALILAALGVQMVLIGVLVAALRRLAPPAPPTKRRDNVIDLAQRRRQRIMIDPEGRN